MLCSVTVKKLTLLLSDRIDRDYRFLIPRGPRVGFRVTQRDRVRDLCFSVYLFFFDCNIVSENQVQISSAPIHCTIARTNKQKNVTQAII